MRSMYRNADAPAHDDAINKCDIGLAEVLDRGIAWTFIAPELQRLLVAFRLTEIVKNPNIPARGKCALARSNDDDAIDGRLRGPAIQLRSQCANHRVRDSVEGFRPVESDESGRAATLEENIVA